MRGRFILVFCLSIAASACGDDPPKKSGTVVTVNSSNASNNTNATNNSGTNSANAANNVNAANSVNAANNANAINNANAANNVNAANNANAVNNVSEVEAKCEQFCDVLLGSCVTDNCALDGDGESRRVEAYNQCMGLGGDPRSSCVNLYGSDSTFAQQVDDAQSWACSFEESQFFRCQNWGFETCGCPVPDLGTSCSADSDCDGGLLSGLCAAENGDSNPGGQCLAGGCLTPEENPAEGQIFFGDSTGCGADGACYVLSQGTVCLETCITNSDCEGGVSPGSSNPGYSCNIITSVDRGNGLEPFGICETACDVGASCAVGDTTGICTQDRLCALTCANSSECPDEFVCTAGAGPNGENVCELDL